MKSSSTEFSLGRINVVKGRRLNRVTERRTGKCKRELT